ncbi:hypothetical protein Tco_1432768, partial [Tanacetum coccineum]
DFIVGGIRTIVNPDTDIQKVYVPQWSVTNGSRLDDGRTCREMMDEFAPPRFFASIRGMKHDQLFTKFNVGAACQMSLSAEVRIDEDVANLKAQLLVKETEATKAIRLRAEVQTLADRNIVLEREKSELDIKVADLAANVKVHKLEASSAVLQDKVTAYDNFIGQLEKFQDDRIREMNEKLNKLDADLVELALHLEERFYPHLLTTISGLLTHGLELAIAKCLNPTEYLSSLGAAIGKAVEKELRSNKDASVDTIMNLLHLEDSLAERLDLDESQPHVNQLMVPIHHSPDQTVIEGTVGTFGTAPGTTTALFVTFASTSTIPPISTDDYEIVHTDDQEGTDADGQTGTGADANPFPSIDDADLNVPE